MLPRPIIAIAATALLAGCGGEPADQPATDTNESNIVELPTLPVPAPPMDRAALLTAALKAASAAAAGIDDLGVQRKLDGNRFEVRIRFGCGGPATAEEQKVMSWRFDPKARTLRVQATPDVSKADPAVAAVAGNAVEAVEGFWISRPWMLRATCPAKPRPPVLTEGSGAGDTGGAVVAKPVPAASEADASAPREPQPVVKPAPIHSIAIAQFFGPTDSRIGRRDDRPYRATKLLDEGIAPSEHGYNLVLSGRLQRLPGGRAIACHIDGADRPPKCVVSADFDRVWIEHPDTKAIIAEWRSGG